jgi:hypothetical protein
MSRIFFLIPLVLLCSVVWTLLLFPFFPNYDTSFFYGLRQFAPEVFASSLLVSSLFVVQLSLVGRWAGIISWRSSTALVVASLAAVSVSILSIFFVFLSFLFVGPIPSLPIASYLLIAGIVLSGPVVAILVWLNLLWRRYFVACLIFMMLLMWSCWGRQVIALGADWIWGGFSDAWSGGNGL